MSGFTQIQKQHATWAAHNFPDAPQHQAILGICEEVGELAAAYLSEDMEKVADSLGDIGIYALHLCNNEGGDFFTQVTDGLRRLHLGKIKAEENPERMLLRVAHCAGRIAHAYLKREQRIRRYEDHSRDIGMAWGDLWVHLTLFAERLDMHLPAIFRQTWGAVMTRDWIADPHNGNTEAS